MTYKIIKCSPEAEAKIEQTVDSVGTSEKQHHKAKFPFQFLKIGQSFILGFECNIASVRSNIARLNKQSLKTFALIRHNKYECYEVARVG